jgi:8-oxo-dGTP pyrophosphatase MutT (NUDIX family)
VSGPEPPVDRECVEGYLFARRPLRLLLFRRPPARGSFWVPISGKVEPEDADLEAALRRELAEETGLRTPEAISALDWHVVFTAPNGETWRLHAYAVEVDPTFAPVLSEEHDACAWVSVDEALGRLHFDDNRGAVRRLRERLGEDADARGVRPNV